MRQTRRRGRRRHRQPSPALRRCRDPAPRLRRGHPGQPGAGDRRGASARGRRDAALRRRRQQLPRRGAGGRRRARAAAGGPPARDARRDPARHAVAARSRARLLHHRGRSRGAGERRGRAVERRLRERAAGPGRPGDRGRDRPDAGGTPRTGALRRGSARHRRDARAGGRGWPRPDRRARQRWSKRPARARRSPTKRRRSDAAPRRCATTCASCCEPTIRRSSSSSRSAAAGIFLRALPIEVSGIVRELVLDRAPHDGAHVGDADHRRLVRLPEGAPGRRPRRVRSCCPRSSTTRRRRSSTCRGACPIRASPISRARAADEVIAILRAHRGPRLRAVHELCVAARGARPRRPGAALPDPHPGHGAARRAARDRSSGRRTRCCSRLRASGRAWTSSARRSAASSSTSCRSPRRAIRSSPHGSRRSPPAAAIPSATLQVPLAILTLLQGLGRLLRHRDDRGVLAILDPRIQTMGYGRRFLASLPPAPITQTLDDITRFMAGDRGAYRRDAG